jgi:uncharacterized protein
VAYSSDFNCEIVLMLAAHHNFLWIPIDCHKSSGASAMNRLLFRHHGKSPQGAPSIRVEAPPTACTGYPPVLIPSNLTSEEQVDFYVPNDDGKLACSLIRSLQADQTGWMPVPSIGSDIDASKPVIIICHGFMSWRNQMLLTHLAGGLSKEMNCHSIRFDFTGNGHSTGTWRYGNFEQEVQDLKAIIQFVRVQMKCQVACVVGHSKAAYAVLQTALYQDEEAFKIPTFCILAGRFSLRGEFDPKARFTEAQLKTFEETGKLMLGTRGEQRLVISQSDIDERMKLDSSGCIGIRSNVIIIHGDADKTVDVANAYRFAEIIPNSELHIVKGADHSFNGLRHIKELVALITSFVRNKAATY